MSILIAAVALFLRVVPAQINIGNSVHHFSLLLMQRQRLKFKHQIL
jgi:hypothetical protein